MTENQAEKHSNFKGEDEAKIEEEFLKGAKDPDIGVYCDMFSAITSIEGQMAELSRRFWLMASIKACLIQQ